ncbi:MAG: hypothetical protein U0996_24015 [Planctomycetaceae bacterium]
MLPASIIAAKRDHREPPEEIAFFIQRYASGDIPDYQMSVLAMAIYLNGSRPGDRVSDVGDAGFRNGAQVAE